MISRTNIVSVIRHDDRVSFSPFPVVDEMIVRAPFGSTGHNSSRIIFGAAALSRANVDVTDEVFSHLRRFGVNHIDTAANYGDSELRIAPHLRGHREEFFLATKTGQRTKDAARAELERSLQRLGVDHVDMIQMHNLVETDEWEIAFGTNGVLEALVQARDEGLVRFIGVTGHGLRIPSMHVRSLERFAFDAVLFPFNFPLMSIPSYRDDVERLLTVCWERSIAVQTIKSIARRRWAESPEARRSWYQPLEDENAIRRSVHYVLSDDRLFLNSTSDYLALPSVLAAGDQPFIAPSEQEMTSDAVELDMSPLFDGASLEHI